jgi:hypothetical protein
MKINKEDFLQMIEKYKKEIKTGSPGQSTSGKINEQTDWVFFDRQTLEGLLEQADKDPLKGGIKFSFAQYNQEIAEKFYPKDSEKYAGMITLVMSPANFENGQIMESTARSGEESYANRGIMCPPMCNGGTGTT